MRRETLASMSDLSQAEADSLGTPENSDPQGTPMVLISVEQRNALIEYLAKMPYQDVAAGISFLRDAPVVNVNVTTSTDNAG